MASTLHETKRDLRILQRGFKSLIQTGFIPEAVIMTQRPICPYNASIDVRCDQECLAFEDTITLHMALEAMLYQARELGTYDSDTLKVATRDLIGMSASVHSNRKCSRD